MTATVLPIGIPPQKRARLCALAAADVCQRSDTHVDAAAQCEAQDAAAAPYIRALYVYRADSVAAERVTVASGRECGSYLRETLRVTVAGIKAPTVACWLTVTLEDTCILQHAVFAISSESKEPLKMAPSLLEKSDGAARPADEQRRPLLPTRELRCAPNGDSVYAPRDETLAAVVPPLPLAAGAGQQQQHSPSAALQPPPIRNVYERMQKNQTDAARDAATRARDSPHVAPPDLGQRSYRAQPKPASRPPRSVSAEPPMRQPSAASSIATSQNSGYPRAPRPNAHQLMYGCPCTDLAVPTDGRQWSDWAFRTCYSPRREELWEIADAVMTHIYHYDMIEGGGEPPHDASRRLRSNEY